MARKKNRNRGGKGGPQQQQQEQQQQERKQEQQKQEQQQQQQQQKQQQQQLQQQQQEQQQKHAQQQQQQQQQPQQWGQKQAAPRASFTLGARDGTRDNNQPRLSIGARDSHAPSPQEQQIGQLQQKIKEEEMRKETNGSTESPAPATQWGQSQSSSPRSGRAQQPRFSIGGRVVPYHIQNTALPMPTTTVPTTNLQEKDKYIYLEPHLRGVRVVGPRRAPAFWEGRERRNSKRVCRSVVVEG